MCGAHDEKRNNLHGIFNPGGKVDYQTMLYVCFLQDAQTAKYRKARPRLHPLHPQLAALCRFMPAITACPPSLPSTLSLPETTNTTASATLAPFVRIR